MRLLLDTNVLVSAILFGGRPRILLERAIGGDLTLVTSPHLLSELESVLTQKFGFSPDAARATREELEAIAAIVQPAAIIPICRDPDDDQVLAAALEGEVEAVVTGDQDLLTLGSYQAIPIVLPVGISEPEAPDE